VNYSFPGQIPFHSFRGDSITRVAETVQSSLAAVRMRRRLEGKLCPSTILRKGW
jgi:hypothetical protein